MLNSIRTLLACCIIMTCMLLGHETNAQYENVWVFGKKAGMDFNSGAPVPIATAVDVYEGCAMVCDKAGQLLFYTEGTKVWNRNHLLMPNGNSLTGLPLLLNGTTPTTSTCQSSVIVPIPGKVFRYYVFSLTSEELGGSTGKLYYSIVNMQLNGGLGDVEPGNKSILLDSLLTEHLTSVLGDRCNAWLLTVSRSQPLIKAYSITESGIDVNPVTSTLLPANINLYHIGKIEASPDRKRLAINRGGLGLYDFDAFTGMANGRITLGNWTSSSFFYYYYGLCFSPDNTKLYTNQYDKIYQFDLSSNDSLQSINSKTWIADRSYVDIKRGPDGKVYVLDNPGSFKTVSIIQQPNMPGVACQFSAAALTLATGTEAATGLPNVITYIPIDSATNRQVVSTGCFASSYNLNIPNGWDHVWMGTTIGSHYTVTQSGTYWVQYRTAPCTYHTDTFVVNISDPLPTLTISGTCANSASGKGRAFMSSTQAGNYSYIWRDANSNVISTSDNITDVPSGNYTVRIITNAGCDTTIAFAIITDDYRVSFDMDTIVCTGGDIGLDNTSNSYFTSFSWSFGDGSTANIANPQYQYSGSGNYNVWLVGYGPVCSDSIYRTITVEAPVDSVTFTTERMDVCVGDPVCFYPRIIGGYVDGLSWQSGNAMRFSKTSEKFCYAYDKAGSVQVTLTAHYRACPDQLYIDTVTVHDLPLVNIGPDTVVCPLQEPLVLINHVYKMNRENYLWQGGETGNSLSVRTPGIYYLTVTNEYNCATTDSIDVKKGCYMHMPNAFSPNGDGINDYFFPRQILSENVVSFHMQVMNRWGQVVFETYNANGRGWDGYFNGVQQPSGVYVYLIEASFSNNTQEKYQGNITLIR